MISPRMRPGSVHSLGTWHCAGTENLGWALGCGHRTRHHEARQRLSREALQTRTAFYWENQDYPHILPLQGSGQRDSDPYLTPHRKINPKQIEGLNLRAKTITYLEENTREKKSSDIRPGKIC